jgi:hypothetical protein
MITAIVGGAILTMFSVMFYLDDRAGGGLYDPDPTAADRYRQQHKQR